jgi:hypothetical protein
MPVMIAVNNNQPDIVRILVKYGARTTGTFKEIYQVLFR